MNWLTDATLLLILGIVQMLTALVLGMMLLRRNSDQQEEDNQ